MDIFLQILFFSAEQESLDSICVVHRRWLITLFSLLAFLVLLTLVLLVVMYLYHRRLRRRKAEFERQVETIRMQAADMARVERDAAWKTMACQIAHEINNPLTPMQLRMQQLQRLHNGGDERFDSYFRESVPLFLGQIDDLSRIASSFSSFAKRPEVEPRSVDVAARLSSVIMLFRSNEYNIPIRYVGADAGVYALADSDQLPEVFTNIIKNAIQAMGETSGGNIIVTMSGVPDADGFIEISISDNGPGIPESIRDKVFVPNFTTKSTGAGLGLTICKNIIEGCGGRIAFSTSSKGTTFYIYLKYENH